MPPQIGHVSQPRTEMTSPRPEILLRQACRRPRCSALNEFTAVSPDFKVNWVALQWQLPRTQDAVKALSFLCLIPASKGARLSTDKEPEPNAKRQCLFDILYGIKLNGKVKIMRCGSIWSTLLKTAWTICEHVASNPRDHISREWNKGVFS